MASSWSFEFLDVVLGRVATLPMETLVSFGAEQAGAALERALALEAGCHKARAELLAELHRLVPLLEDRKLRHEALELKRALSRPGWPKIDVSSLAGAQPAAGASALAERFNELGRARGLACAQARARFEEALPALRERLLGLFSDPFFRETLRLSSQKLLEAVERYERQPPKPEPARWHRRVERSVLEHLARCCAKTTPRANLTAVHLGAVDRALPQAASVRRGKAAPGISRKKTVLSLTVARGLARAVSAAGETWRHIVPRPNPTMRLDAASGDLKYWRKEARKQEVYYRLPATPLLAAFVEECRPRRWTAQELLRRAQERFPEYSAQELETFYRKLGSLDVLRTGLEIPFAESDGLGYVVGWLRGLPEAARPRPLYEELSEIEAEIRKLEELSLPPEEAVRIERRVGALLQRHTGHALSASQFLIVDTVSVWENLRVGAGTLDGLRRVLEALARFNDAGAQPQQQALEGQLQALRERFPGRSEVPALDLFAPQEQEPAPSDARAAASPRALKDGEAADGRVRRLAELLERRGAAAGVRQEEIRLTAEDFERIVEDAPERSGVTSGSFTVHLARSKDEKETVRLVVDSTFFAACAQNFSRWSKLLSDEDGLSPIERCLKGHYRDLGREVFGPNLAGLVYLEEAKTDTAGWHPSYHALEIESMGPPSLLPEERRVPLDRLFISFDGELRAYAERGGARTELVPIYEGLQNIRHEPMLRALSRVSSTRLRWLFFRPVTTLADEFGPLPRYLPRLVLGNVALSRRTWVLRAQALQNRLDALQDWELFDAFNAWRLEQAMPRFIFVQTQRPGREKLGKPHVVDAYNPFLLDALGSALRALAPETEVWIFEMLPAPDELWTRDERGGYAHELTIGFHGRSKVPAPAAP